ncbi:holliday junction resolvase [Blastocystis sp. subtype 4]|uniref:holliday junction resolvase n=1 Tax=Blastocystis sp. subtype 4 TaxID=944170 RepID=UPI000711748D|nr:holliday junction resolvase [Blastocystis sp. subtype 4]KNB42063.1 holliday junction resolvase [Blastocystis sp. subtype 4]|eukprot:XP_014525506.1 holliday junction resolvase [Blastocystis sp. subtype 4]
MPVVSASQLKQIYSKVSRIRPRLVGLDVGTTNVGVALSDPSLKVALPQTTLQRSSYENLLYPILKENKVFAMIVGFPYLVDGSESVQCEDVKFFVHEFLKNSGITIPIVYHNELYTTQIAMEPYSGKRRRDWNEGLRKKDQNAAAFVLFVFKRTTNQIIILR